MPSWKCSKCEYAKSQIFCFLQNSQVLLCLNFANVEFAADTRRRADNLEAKMKVFR